MAARPTSDADRATRGLLIGLVGSILLSLGGFALVRPTDGYHLPGIDVLHRMSPNYGLGDGLVLCGVGLLVIGWVMLAEVSLSVRRVVVTAVCWALPMLVAPPLLSTDMYLYADQGWQQLQGLNPYDTALGSAGPYAPLVSDAWRGTFAVYPPLALRLQALAVAPALGLAGALGVPVAPVTLPALRLVSVAAVALLGWGAVQLARRFGRSPGFALWWVVLNPITIVHLVGDGHNDAGAAALVMVALVVAGRRHGWLWGGLLIGIAACIKQPVLFAVVPVGMLAAQRWRAASSPTSRAVRTALTVAGAIVAGGLAFVAVHLLCGLGAGWIDGLTVPGEVGTWAPASMVLAVASAVAEGLQVPLAEGAQEVVLWIVRAVLLVGLATVVWRWRRSPVSVAGAGLTVVALALESLRTWYLSWGFGTFAFAARPRALGPMAGLASGLVVADAIHKHAAMGRIAELSLGVAVGLSVAMVMTRTLTERLDPYRISDVDRADESERTTRLAEVFDDAEAMDDDHGGGARSSRADGQRSVPGGGGR